MSAGTRVDFMPRDYIAKRAGTSKWVLASRLTDRLRERGYERAIHRRTWDKWQAEWESDRPTCHHCGQVMP